MTRKLTLFLVCAFEVALILFVAAWTAWAETTVEFKSGDALLSNDISYDLTLTTIGADYDGAKLFLSCNTSKQWEAQLAVSQTIFPDRVGDNIMYEEVTFKVEGVNHVERGEWSMNLMKYKNLFFRGDARAFVLRLNDGTRINIGVQSSIYQFDLEDTKAHIQEMKKHCL